MAQIMIEAERWLPIKGYEGIYEVSNLGRIRNIRKSQGTSVGKILASRNSKRVYPSTTLTIDYNHRTFYIHILVAEAFLGCRPSPNHEVNHINGDKNDCRLNNLEWVTECGNKSHAVRNGFTSNGSRNRHAKLTEEKVLQIRSSTDSAKELALEYGVTEETIQRIINRHTWKRT